MRAVLQTARRRRPIASPLVQHRRRVLLVTAVALSALAAACGGGGRPTLDRKATASPSTSPTTLPSFVSLIARVRVPNIAVYDTPASPSPSKSFANPWPLNNDPKLPVELVFLVEQRQGPWLKVLLPIRPNGTTGWVHARDVALQEDQFHITVELHAHRLTVYNGDAVMLSDTVAVGMPATPTPTGTYFIRVLLKAPDPTTVYGPYAYGLSGHSEALDTFDGGDAELGIHGNNDASVLGTDASHGCIRMSNDKITSLAGVLPLGTPVTITA
jgi:lipoprotein-anchoring transpeptidase ErfK/SrfK